VFRGLYKTVIYESHVPQRAAAARSAAQKAALRAVRQREAASPAARKPKAQPLAHATRWQKPSAAGRRAQVYSEGSVSG